VSSAPVATTGGAGRTAGRPGAAASGLGTLPKVGGTPRPDQWLPGHTITNARPMTFAIGT
jgi:hypothetical protein